MSDVDEGSQEDWRNKDDDIEGGPDEIERYLREDARRKGQTKASLLEDSDFEQSPEIERVQFLKEYAKDITRSPEQVASSLHIAQRKAADYLKYYVYLMVNSANDPDPTRVRISINKALREKKYPAKSFITDSELVTLQPLIDRYSDLDVLDSSRKAQQTASQNLMKQKVSNAFGFGLSNEPNGNVNNFGFPGDPDNTSPHPSGNGRPASSAARLSNSGRVNLLRWVLEKMPHIHYSRIEPFLELFEAGEMKYMSSPDQLHEIMTKYFGPHAGGLAFNQFKDLITSYLKPSEQFGQNPYFGGGTAGMGGGGYAPWAGSGTGGYGTPQPVNMYVAMGVIPAGVDPRSPEAQRMIWEFQQDQRKKKSAEEMQENIKNYVNLKMMDIVDPRKSGGGGMGMGGDGMLAPLLMSGALRAVPSTDEQGRPVMKYEHTGIQPQNGGEDKMLGMMRIMMEMYNAILAQQNQAPRFLESILNTMLGKFSTQSDPFELAVNAKKLADTFNPPGGGGIQQSLEAAKILLARDKMSTDRDLTLQKMNFEHENEMYDRKKQDEQEVQSKEQTNEIVKNIFQIGGQTLVPLLSMFLGRGGGAGGLAGMMQQMQNGGMAAGIPSPGEMSGMGIPTGGDVMGGGMGMPQEMGGMGVPPGAGMPVDMNQIIGMQQQRQQGNPQWFAEPSTEFGYGAGPTMPRYEPPPPPTPQQQWQMYGQPPQQQYGQQQQANFSSGPQPMTEVVQQEVGPVEQKRFYTPQDFDHLSLEELERYRMEGENNRDSIDSFNNALRAAIQNKMYANPQEIPTQTQLEMPSNVSMSQEDAPTPTRTVLDEMAESEPETEVDHKDLRVLPDTPEVEPSKPTDNDDIG